MKIHSLLILFLLCSSFAFVSAEEFTSSGFSASITPSGVVKNLKYGDLPLVDSILIQGTYDIAPEQKKHDNRFFQTWVNKATPVFERKDNQLSMSVKATLGNSFYPEGAEYEQTCVFTPRKITWHNRITHKVTLLTTYSIFRSILGINPSLQGRGTRFTSVSDQTEFQILPETYSKAFGIRAKELKVSTTKGILSFTLDNALLVFQDDRAWGGKSFSFNIHPLCKWSRTPVAFPAGSVWEWSYTLSFDEE